MFQLKPIWGNVNATIKPIMGYAIPKNCAVIYPGNIVHLLNARKGQIPGKDFACSQQKKLLQEKGYGQWLHNVQEILQSQAKDLMTEIGSSGSFS